MPPASSVLSQLQPQFFSSFFNCEILNIFFLFLPLSPVQNSHLPPFSLPPFVILPPPIYPDPPPPSPSTSHLSPLAWPNLLRVITTRGITIVIFGFLLNGSPLTSITRCSNLLVKSGISFWIFFPLLSISRGVRESDLTNLLIDYNDES